jgi:hypothetical protein
VVYFIKHFHHFHDETEDNHECVSDFGGPGRESNQVSPESEATFGLNILNFIRYVRHHTNFRR